MLTKLKSKFLRSIKNKRLNVFGLFLLIAFIILVLSKLSNTYTEDLSIAIDFTNLPNDKVLIIDKQPKLDVVVSTYGFKLLTYYLFDTPIAIDLENHAHIKNSTYIWVANRALPSIEKQFGSSVKIISVQPDTLKFSFDALVIKKVPVQLNHDVTFASGYGSFDGFKIVPDSVKIFGSNDEVSKIDKIETAQFNSKDINRDIKKSIALKFPESSHTLKLEQSRVEVTSKVEKFTEGTLEIPITLKNLPSGIQINYFPKTIKVSYDVSLQDYKNIKSKDFKIECDYLDVNKSNQTFFTPHLMSQPKKVKNVKLKQNKIEYIITQ